MQQQTPGNSAGNNIPCTMAIRNLYPNLSASEKKVANYVISNGEDLIKKTINEVSDIIGVSETSIMKFCRHIGYSGYSQLKLMLAQEIGAKADDHYKNIKDLNVTKNDKLEDVSYKVVNRTIQALQDTLKVFNFDDFNNAVKAISKCNKLHIYGVANSASVADDALNKFIKIGINCSVFSDSHLQLMSAATLGKKDVAMGISHSGRTKETVDVLKVAKSKGATTICLTNYTASLITEVSDIKLFTASYETEFNSESMVSRITQLAIIDMLYTGVLLQDHEKYIKVLSSVNDVLNHKAY